MDTRSPSQPRLLYINKESNAGLALSGNSPLTPNKKQRDEYNKKHNISKHKRRKLKELKIKFNLPQMEQNSNNNTPNGLRNRSTSLIFTPSQLESAAKYSFKTIQEQPSPNNNSNTHSDSPSPVISTPKFSAHHSTPIFYVNNPIANNLYYPSHNNNNNIIDDDIDNMTPRLPPQKEDNNSPLFYHTASQKASLPPQQNGNNHNNGNLQYALSTPTIPRTSTNSKKIL